MTLEPGRKYSHIYQIHDGPYLFVGLNSWGSFVMEYNGKLLTYEAKPELWRPYENIITWKTAIVWSKFYKQYVFYSYDSSKNAQEIINELQKDSTVQVVRVEHHSALLPNEIM